MKEESNVVERLPYSERVHQIVSLYEGARWDYRLWWITSSALAMHYGFWNRQTNNHTEALINMNRVLATRAELQPGDRVLDAGCGVGGSAIWLAREFGVRAVGLTLVPSEVERGRRYARRRGVADLVRLDRLDIARTTLPDSSFDVIWAIESVCHVPDKREFLAEARRLLKPGGRLVVADGFRPRRPFSPADERLLHDMLAGWAVPDLVTPEEFTDAARQVGFAHVRFEDVTTNILPSARRLYRIARMLYPVGVVKRALGLFTDVQLGNRRAVLRQYRVIQRGLAIYGIVTAAPSARYQKGCNTR
jgi:tocopherol O-methyltransferase